MALINWSPSGDWLFVGHVNSLCRVWETRQWTCEKWTNLAGRCKVCMNTLEPLLKGHYGTTEFFHHKRYPL